MQQVGEPVLQLWDDRRTRSAMRQACVYIRISMIVLLFVSRHFSGALLSSQVQITIAAACCPVFFAGQHESQRDFRWCTESKRPAQHGGTHSSGQGQAEHEAWQALRSSGGNVG